MSDLLDNARDLSTQMLAIAFDNRLPNDLAFAQVVLGAACHFDLSADQLRVALTFLLHRPASPGAPSHSDPPPP